MLQFFKKSGRTSNCDGKSSVEKRHSIPANYVFLDENYVEENTEIDETRSRLSKKLNEIVLDKNCLSYFVQFLEVKKALSLIKFYLDVESFKTASELSLKSSNPTPRRILNKYHRITDDRQDTISDDIITSSFRENNKSTSSEGYDSLSFTSFDICDRISISSQSENQILDNKSDKNFENNDNDEEKEEVFKKTDDFVRKPLTDDEKTKILSEETNIKSKSEISSDKINTTIATDAIRIYKKYLTLNSQYFIDIPATIISNISLKIGGQENDGQIQSICFEEAQKYIFERLEIDYLNEFLDSIYYCKYCVDILSSENLQLYDILYSESVLFYFMEYLEQENQRNLLEFWMAAINFRNHYKKNLRNFIKKEAQNDAMIIYEKYFSLQSFNRLNISDCVRSRVEELICTDNETVIKCFDLPIRIIEKYIEKNYLKNFLSSQLFVSYCNELRSKIKDHKIAIIEKRNSFKKRRHRKAYSDCTYDNTRNIRNSFISEQNTLLAMETSKPKNHHHPHHPTLTASTSMTMKSGDMQIDLRQLTNPDLLWQRNNCDGNSNGLIFGRVDSLGRYERDFEIESTDEKWSLSNGGNKIKQAVRKLVNLPEDKVQEEIAWQIAEMIVKDVTSVTLGVKNNNSEQSG